MTANVETMFSVRQTPWHGLGTVLPDAPTVKEGILAAGLNWRVDQYPAYINTGNGTLPVPDTQVNVRDTDHAVLGVVGKQYVPLQNEEAFEFFSPWLGSGVASLECAGALDDGKIIWVLSRLNGVDREVVDGDPIQSFLLLYHSHDGRYPVTVQSTDIRVVCANTLRMAQRASKAIASARHTANLCDRMEDMQDTIAALRAEFDEAVKSYRRLASVQVPGEKKLQGYIREVLQSKEPDTRSARGESNIISLFEHGQGQDNPHVGGTWWAAFNAVTEYVDWERGKDQSRRLQSAWFGQGTAVKDRALSTALNHAA